MFYIQSEIRSPQSVFYADREARLLSSNGG